MPDNTNQKNKSDMNKSDLNKDREQMGNQGGQQRQGQSQGGQGGQSGQGGMRDKGSTNIEKEDRNQVSNDNDQGEFQDRDEGSEIESEPRQGNQQQVSGTNRGNVDRDRK